MARDGGLLADVRQEDELAELRAAYQRLMRKAARQEADRQALEEAIYRAARDAVVTMGPPKQIDRPQRDRRRDPLEALLHLTDWHVGKVTPTFDTETCERRIHEAIAKTIRLTEIERADHPVRVIHAMVGGDLVEAVSDIFPGQHWEVEPGGALDQAVRAAKILSDSLVTLLAEFERVHVWWVAGNHGRIGRRGQFPKEDNLDRHACMLAKIMLGERDRLTWHDPDPHDHWYQIVEAGNYRAALFHGHQIPRTTPAILRKLHQWKAVLPPWHDAFYGHVHSEFVFQLADGGVAFVTPSVESSNAYAKEVIAALGVPAQRLHFVRPEKGQRASEQLLFLK